MKRIIVFLLLFAAIKVAGQTTGYLRFDTVRIMKQNGTCELYIINKTKDSLGLLTNVGGGLTQFKRSRALTDSTLIVGNDTVKIMGGSLARNGLTKNGAYTELGGTLVQNTDISMGGDSLRFTDSGWVRIRTASGVNPPLIVQNTTPGFRDVAHFIGENCPIRLFATASNGFPGLTFYSGPTNDLKAAIGYDGNFDHFYLVDIKNTPSATIESNGSTFAAFTKGKNFGIGDLPVRDSARINVYTTGSYTTSDSSNRWFVGQNYGSTFNTSGGAIINRPFILKNSATRSAGAPSLTNVTMQLTAVGAQINNALVVDTGKVVVGLTGLSTALANITSYATVANLGVTQDRSAGYFEVGRTLTDTVGSSQTFSAAVYGRSTYSAKASASIPDNLSGSGGEFQLQLVRNTAFSGRTVYQGLFTPTNGVSTMAAGLSARLSVNQSNTGGNSVRTNGWFAALSTHISLNTGDTLSNAVWGNFGAAQTTGGAIDSGYAIYINALPSLVATKYAIYQAGTNDSSIYKGPLKTFNFQADKTVTAGGTTGDQTINKISGTVNFAAGATSLTVTNNLVTANSNVFPVIRTVDATAKSAVIVCSLGSFTITLNAAATAETSVGFLVVN